MNSMKKIIISLLFATLMIAPSCVKRVTIPDDELALIFRDAFLTNAYVLDERVRFDTLQVYQPIFDKYGYTAEDVAYTVGSFSKRKSARLSDVVEQSIELLESGQAYYAHETMILDTIDDRALRSARKLFYSKELVEYYSLKDTTDLRIELDSLHPGKYDISFDYFIDSLDNNKGSYRIMSWAPLAGSNQKRGVVTGYLRKNSKNSYERTVKIDTMTGKYVIMLAETYEAKRKPHITFNDIRIEYTPPLDEAVEKFYKKKMNIRIFANDFFNIQQADSLELPTL